MLKVLLVEDNIGDIRLTQEAFRDANFSNQVDVVEDGEKAIQYLKGENGYETKGKPDLILLDLNLPRKSGLEVLAEIKGSKGLKRTPVVILTTSTNEQDIIQCYDLHANCFISKPMDMDEFIEMVSSLGDFWYGKVILPNKTS